MKKTIFLADDSITIQKVVELTFSSTRYEVICAGNGTLAVQRIASTTPDIALIDIHMPDIDGYDVCAQIRADASTAWMPVILLTGAFESYDEAKAKSAGADGHLRKPFESRSLLARVEEMLTARPRPGIESDVPLPGATSQSSTPRLDATSFFDRVPPGPGAAQTVGSVPFADTAVEKAAREAVTAICEKIVREIAWEVIPDLAEAIVKRRIQQLEADAESVD